MRRVFVPICPPIGAAFCILLALAPEALRGDVDAAAVYPAFPDGYVDQEVGIDGDVHDDCAGPDCPGETTVDFFIDIEAKHFSLTSETYSNWDFQTYSGSATFFYTGFDGISLEGDVDYRVSVDVSYTDDIVFSRSALQETREIYWDGEPDVRLSGLNVSALEANASVDVTFDAENHGNADARDYVFRVVHGGSALGSITETVEAHPSNPAATEISGTVAVPGGFPPGLQTIEVEAAPTSGGSAVEVASRSFAFVAPGPEIEVVEVVRIEPRRCGPAADELARAYMGGGAEIFDDEDPKYWDFIRTKLQLPA